MKYSEDQGPADRDAGEVGESHSSCTEVVGIIGGLSVILDLCYFLCGTPLRITLVSFLLL